MSFGPISLLVPRFKSSTYNSMPPVYNPQIVWDQTGSPAERAMPLNIIKSMLNPAMLGKLGPAAILNQNPIFEMGSDQSTSRVESQILRAKRPIHRSEPTLLAAAG